MAAVIKYGIAANRKNMAARRVRLGDGVTLSTPDGASFNFRRIDSTFVITPPNSELAGLIEDSFYSEEVVRIKNTTGGSIGPGTLLVGTTSLTATGTATSPNISAGASVVVVLTVTGTIEIGSLVSFTDSVSPNDIQYSICTAKSGTSYTFDEIKYDMTTPAVAAVACNIPALATNASAGHATWVTTTTIANNAYGDVYGAAIVGGLDTSGYSARGSNVYLGTGGAATPTAPTTSTTTSQLIGKVIVKDASVGIIQFFPYRRDIVKIGSGSFQSGIGLPAGVTAGDLLIDQGSGSAATFNAMSGDATINSTGVLTIGSAKCTVPKGGTGLATLTAHAIQVGNGTSTVTQLAVGGAGTLLSGAASADPVFSATPTLGVSGTTQGKLTIAGSTSGSCEISTNVAAGTSTKFVLPNTNGSNTNVLKTDGSGNTSWTAAGTGTGTVTNTGGNLTSNAVVLGAGTVDTKVVAGIITDGTSQLTLGVNTTTLGKVKMFGNTSGDVTIQPNAVAGTGIILTLPATTDTLVGKTTADTLTNKTLTSPTLVTPALGTPTSGTLTNCVVSATNISGIVPSANGGRGVISEQILTGNTTAQSNIGGLTNSTGSDFCFNICVYINVTTSSSESFNATCTYTDETNTSRTITLPFVKIDGSIATTIFGAGPYSGIPVRIRSKSTTSILCATSGTFTGCTYNVESIITQD